VSQQQCPAETAAAAAAAAPHLLLEVCLYLVVQLGVTLLEADGGTNKPRHQNETQSHHRASHPRNRPETHMQHSAAAMTQIPKVSNNGTPPCRSLS
jgi:hypothetical protein